MSDTKINPQGYLYGKDPKASHPFWDEGQLTPVSEYVKSVGGTEETTDTGTTYTISQTDGNDAVKEVLKILVPKVSETPTITDYVKDVTMTEESTDNGTDYTFSKTGGNDSVSEIGKVSVPKQGVQKAVQSIRVTETVNTDSKTYTFYATDESGTETTVCTLVIPTVYVKTFTVTNENGIYTLTTTNADGTTSASTIEVPEVNADNLIAEINDAIVENDTDGYDFHTLTETENNGTKNEVGKFYIARKQITSFNSKSNTTAGGAISVPVINQDGTSGTMTIITSALSESSYGGFNFGDQYNADSYFRDKFLTNFGNTAEDGVNGADYCRIKHTGEENRIFADAKEEFNIPTYGYLQRGTLPEATLNNITENTSFVSVEITFQMSSSSTRVVTSYGHTFLNDGNRIVILPTFIIKAGAELHNTFFANAIIDFSNTTNYIYLYGPVADYRFIGRRRFDPQSITITGLN